MSPQLIGFVAPPAVAVVVGLVFAFFGFRGRTRYKTLFKIGGPLFLLGALVWFLVTPPPDGWSRHATADGACSIEFPQAPKHEVTPGGEGDRLAVALIDRNVDYSLTFSEAPEWAHIPLDNQFDVLRAEYSKKTETRPASRLVKELAITERGFPGREYQFAVGDQLVTRIKVFINGPRIYRAIAVNPPDAKLDRDAQRFIDSFRFEINKP